MVSRTFLGQGQALAWAKAQWVAAQTGRRVDAQRRTLTSALVADYLTGMTGLGRTAKYLADVRRSLEACAAAVPDLEAPGVTEALERWLAGLTCAPATRNKHLRALRALCTWAVDRERLSRNPSRLIRMAQVPDYLRDQFTVADIRQALAYTHYRTTRDDQPKEHPFHRLFAVLIYTGMRVQEAAHLRWQDIDFQGRTIAVRLAAGAAVKRQRERLVPLQDELAAILLPHRRDAGPVFRAQRFNPSRGFRAFLRKAGLRDACSPHSCRHSYAGLMTATGVPGLLLGAYLGHASVNTTAIYTKLAAAYAQHPEVQTWPRGVLRFRGSA
jgi:integrase